MWGAMSTVGNPAGTIYEPVLRDDVSVYLFYTNPDLCWSFQYSPQQTKRLNKAFYLILITLNIENKYIFECEKKLKSKCNKIIF